MSIAFRRARLGRVTAGGQSESALDRRFIRDAWARTYQLANTAGMISMDDWFAVMIPQIDKVLDREDVTTIVAYDTETPPPADIYGFITADITIHPALVYYCLIKEPYRRQGIARALFAAIDVDPDGPMYTVCDTPTVGVLRRAGKLALAKWRPLLGRTPKNEWRTECPQSRQKPRR